MKSMKKMKYTSLVLHALHGQFLIPYSQFSLSLLPASSANQLRQVVPVAQLAFRNDVPDVLTDILLRRSEQVGHHLLGQPDRLVLQAHIEFHFTIIGSIDQKLTLGRQVIVHVTPPVFIAIHAFPCLPWFNSLFTIHYS